MGSAAAAASEAPSMAANVGVRLRLLSEFERRLRGKGETGRGLVLAVGGNRKGEVEIGSKASMVRLEKGGKIKGIKEEIVC